MFLSFSLPSITIFPALEADLEPFEKLRRVDVLSRVGLTVLSLRRL